MFDSGGVARTFDYHAGDVGIVPLVAGHYIQNIGDEKVIFLEIFKNPGIPRSHLTSGSPRTRR